MRTALPDTCVLVPSRARDVLLEIASAGAYRPLWSSEILAELDRTLRLLLAKRAGPPRQRTRGAAAVNGRVHLGPAHQPTPIVRWSHPSALRVRAVT